MTTNEALGRSTRRKRQLGALLVVVFLFGAIMAVRAEIQSIWLRGLVAGLAAAILGLAFTLFGLRSKK